jgi:hypothetical protein
MANVKFDSKLFAKDILKKRTTDGLTFRAIHAATKGKLSISTLQRIEAGTQVPTAETLADVCNWLKIPVQNYFH